MRETPNEALAQGSERLTDAELARLEELCEKATPGPWTVIIRGERGTFHIPEAQKHEAQHADAGMDGASVSHANAYLICALPMILRKLLDEVKASRVAHSQPPAEVSQP